MRNLLFHRGPALAAAAAAAWLLTACGGGTDNSAGDPPVVLQSAGPVGEVPVRAAADAPAARDDVLAADAGAAQQEPR